LQRRRDQIEAALKKRAIVQPIIPQPGAAAAAPEETTEKPKTESRAALST